MFGIKKLYKKNNPIICKELYSREIETKVILGEN